MSKADEMFEKLNYRKTQDDKENCTFYKDPKQGYVIFDKGNKNIDLYISINIQELQAINEKVKELGWLDE